MAASNNRIREFDTVHHLMSRIAHKVRILSKEDRDDFLEIFRRAAEFVGVRLIGWCIMTNHFHLLVYLPEPIVPDEYEVLRRYGVLKGAKAMRDKQEEIARLRASGFSGEAEAWLDAQRKRMYDIGSFMKIAKQWFTEAYNSRYAHTGTLWEAEYVDRPVKRTTSEMAKRLAYVHLNPVRAAMTDRFDGYVWSSFSAFRRGDPLAVEGMRFVYGGGGTPDEIAEIGERHETLMAELLEEEKRRRAEEIARRRAAGQEAPCDPLTTEALVIQAAAHLEEVRRAGASVWESRCNLFSQFEREVLAQLYLDPSLATAALIARLGSSKSSVYRALESLTEKGALERLDKTGVWIVHPPVPCVGTRSGTVPRAAVGTSLSITFLSLLSFC